MSSQTPLPSGRMSTLGGGSRMSSQKYPLRTPLRAANGNDRRESIRETFASNAFKTPGPGGHGHAAPSLGRTPRATGRRLTTNPHPTNDKKWQHGVIRNLMSVLEEHHYSVQLTMKQLMSPTTREFQQIIQFLFQIIDEDFEFDSKRVDEDIIWMLKMLKYPFTISKTSLAAPGAPTTWHNLLAVLQFLCELIQGMKENQITELTAYQSYCFQTYTEYMNGANDFPELDAAYSEAVDRDLQKRAARLEESKRTLQHLKERKAALENQDTLETVSQRIADLERKKQKHQQYHAQMEEHLAMKQRSLEEKRAEASHILAEAKRMRAELDQREAVLANQKFSVADVERVRQELAHYTNLQQQLQAQQQQVEQENSELTAQRREKQQKLRGLAEEMNSAMRLLRGKTVDPAPQNTPPLEFPPNFDPANYSAADQEKFVEAISQEVERRHSSEQSRSIAAANQLREAQHARDIAQRSLQEREQELEIARQKERKLAELHDQLRATKLRTLQKEQDEMQFKLHQFASVDPHDGMGKMRLQQMQLDFQKESDDIEEQILAMDKERDNIERQACEFRKVVYESLVAHKNDLISQTEAMQRMNQEYDQILQDLPRHLQQIDLNSAPSSHPAGGQENVPRVSVADKVQQQLNELKSPNRSRIPLQARNVNVHDDELAFSRITPDRPM